MLLGKLENVIEMIERRILKLSKPRRNDPCPCGSGKKYKKCCGGSNVVAFDPSFFNNELQRLSEGLGEYALNHFRSELSVHAKKYAEVYLNTSEEEASNDYQHALTPWMVLNERIKNEQTVFDLYFDNRRNKIKHPSIEKAFSTWSGGVKGIFKIVSVEGNPSTSITLEDMFTGQTYSCQPREITTEDIGGFVIGTLIPYVHIYDFFFGMIQVSENQTDQILEIVDAFKASAEKKEDIYPGLLAKIIQPSEDFKWTHTEHELVADLFTDHMNKKGFERELIAKGVMLWNEYCNHNNPNIRKREGYAAALEYIVQQNFAEDATVTQAQLAKEYGTTSGTISTNSRKLQAYVA